MLAVIAICVTRLFTLTQKSPKGIELYDCSVGISLKGKQELTAAGVCVMASLSS